MSKAIKPRPITTEETALAFADLSTLYWCVVARRERMEERWNYYMPRTDVRTLHAAKEAGRVIVLQDQSQPTLIAYGKLVARA